MQSDLLQTKQFDHCHKLMILSLFIFLADQNSRRREKLVKQQTLQTLHCILTKKNMGRDHSPSGDRRERRREKDKNRRRHRSRSVEKSRERKRSRSPRDRHVDRRPRSESPIDVDKPTTTRHSIYIYQDSKLLPHVVYFGEGPFKYYVSTRLGGGGFRNWPFLLTNSTQRLGGWVRKSQKSCLREI